MTQKPGPVPPPEGYPPPSWPRPQPGRRSYAGVWWTAMAGCIALAIGQIGEANGSLVSASKAGHVYGALGFILLAVACLVGGLASRG